MNIGHCYRDALAFLLSHRWVRDIRLVHGILTNPSGKKIGHAWIEHRLTVGGIVTVYDVTVKEHWPRQRYYQGYKAENLHYYTYEDACRLADESDLCGPWDIVSHRFLVENKVPPGTETKASRRWKHRLFAKHKENPNV